MPNAGSYILVKWLSDKIREKIKTSQKKGSQTNLRQINGPELPIKKQRLQKNIKNLESDYANGKISEEEYTKRLNYILNNS